MIHNCPSGMNLGVSRNTRLSINPYVLLSLFVGFHILIMILLKFIVKQKSLESNQESWNQAKTPITSNKIYHVGSLMSPTI